MPLFQEIFNVFRVSVFLPCCACCREVLVKKEEMCLCQACQGKIVPYTDPTCLKCGKALPLGQEICGECLVHNPPFRRHVSFSRYEGVMKEIILLYKFGQLRPLGKILSGCLVERFRASIDGSFRWIVPVPADRGRKREFDPMKDLARNLSRELGIDLLKNNLVKVKKTLPQVKLTQARRLKNLDGAFRLKRPVQVKNTRVLLVDDVYTTGTTIKQCSRQLKKAGAEVVAITLARSV